MGKLLVSRKNIVVSKDSIGIDKDLTKEPKFEHIQNVLQAEKDQRQVPGQKSKKSFVCVSLHCWQCVERLHLLNAVSVVARAWCYRLRRRHAPGLLLHM